MVPEETELTFRRCVNEIQYKYSQEKAEYIDNLIFDIYGLSLREKQAIGFINIQ